MVANSNSAPANDPWYADSAANQHISANLENLSLQQPYLGFEDTAVGNGTGLRILHTGSMVFHTPQSSFHLSKVLHCSQAYANLLSINQFSLNNNCFFILTGSQYFVKDNCTGLTLLEGRSEGGLYPIQPKSFSVNKQHALTALLGVKTFAAVAFPPWSCFPANCFSSSEVVFSSGQWSQTIEWYLRTLSTRQKQATSISIFSLCLYVSLRSHPFGCLVLFY